MNDLSELLHDAMADVTDGMTLDPNAARLALRSAQRARRTQRVVGAGAAVALVGGTAAAVAVAAPSHGGHPGRSATLIQPGAKGKKKHPAITAHVTVAMSHPTVQSKGADDAPPQALQDISIPAQAPGFPVQRAEPTVSMTGMWNGTYWADAFLVARTADQCTSLGPQPSPSDGSAPSNSAGSETCTPTGPEATVLVTEGAEPTAPGTDSKIEGNPVIGTTTVDGQSAYITHDGDETDIFYAAGPFAVLLVGDEGATVSDLVTLGNSINGLV